jgi:hypothetical protein
MLGCGDRSSVVEPSVVVRVVAGSNPVGRPIYPLYLTFHNDIANLRERGILPTRGFFKMAQGQSIFSGWSAVGSLFEAFGLTTEPVYTQDQIRDAEILIASKAGWMLIDECFYGHPVASIRAETADERDTLEQALKALNSEFKYDTDKGLLSILLDRNGNKALYAIEQSLQPKTRIKRHEFQAFVSSMDATPAQI